MDNFFNDVLRGLVQYRIGIFFVLAVGLVIYLSRFLRGLREWQRSVFGLERSMAQRKLVGAVAGLVLLVLLFVGEFLLATVVGPQMPAVSVEEPTQMDSLSIATVTLAADEVGESPTPVATIDQASLVSECIEGVTEITSPANGQTVSGTVELIGSVNVENFGSYKYEFSNTGSINWTTIAANNSLKLNESLGYWYTSNLTPGTYLLQLVPLDNTGEEMTPCIVAVEVVPDSEE
jgi:hypothetical protein